MKVFNNLTRKLEEFEPLNSPEVSIYSCGPTVYDVSHIGHARSALTWDLLARYLKYRGYKVKWARNITNIDDKIVNRAKELNISPDQLSREYTYEFWKDMSALNVSWPEFEPRATDYLREMFNFIQGLIDKGAAYESNGDVYFRVSKHKDYGQLKGLDIEELKKGISRVDDNERKEDQLDFALWKAFPDQPETSFQSPWSLGRPGWHLECSTMIHSLFNGSTIDIHAGGDDLIFPHHENECAQSECLTDKALAKYWMHNGMIMINGRKMSKSENNFLTIKDVLGKYKANTVRYFCLSTHYKKQINFTDEALKAAEAGFEKLYQTAKKFIKTEKKKVGALEEDIRVLDIDHEHLDGELIASFEEAMNNDMNTAIALAALFEHRSKKHCEKTIAYLLDVLGFDLVNHEFSQSLSSASANGSSALDAAMDLVLEFRREARSKKDFATSDKIRDSLAQAGIEIKDYRDKPSEWVKC